MDAFWKWLMRTNARGVLSCALLAFVVVTAWWIWKSFNPDTDAPVILSSNTGRKNRPELGLMSFMDKQYAVRDVPAADPFQFPRSYRPPVFTNVTGVVPHHTGGDTPPPPTPRPEPVRLTYRGIYRAADGQIRILVEDSKSNSRSFYHPTGVVQGVRISGVTTQELTLVAADGTPITLKLGQPRGFLNGRLAD